MLFQVEQNIKEIKTVNDTQLEAIDYVKIVATNLNNQEDIYDKGEN